MFYKFVLRTGNIESSEKWNIGYRFDNAEFGKRIQTHFSEKVRLALKLCEDFLFMLECRTNLFSSLPKPESNFLCYSMLVKGSNMPKFLDESKTIFLAMQGKP